MAERRRYSCAVFGWLDRIAEAIYRRGQALTEADAQVTEERRVAIRSVRDALRDSMAHAEHDRDHGRDEDQRASIDAANLASATGREILDDEARTLVAAWKSQFDAIRKGYGKDGQGELKNMYTGERSPTGYPEPEWSELRAAADAAQERLGAVLRELMSPTR